MRIANQEISRDHVWAWIMGLGIALFPVHNRALTDLTTSSSGQVFLFLPQLGSILWVMGALGFVGYNWRRVQSVGWGERRVYIPLLVIVAAISLSGITADTLTAAVAPMFMGIALFALYLASRVLGRDLFLPHAIGAAIASVGIIVFAVLHPGRTTGGYVFEQNFDIATGYILLGAALFIHRWRWMLVGVAVVALFLSGAPEFVFVIGVMGMVMLIRRDWGKRLFYLAVPVVLAVVIVFWVGAGSRLYGYAADVVRGEVTVDFVDQDMTLIQGSAIGYRFNVIGKALSNIRPFGEGYNLTGFTVNTVHNVPLVLVQQLGWFGIGAALAWLWASLYCLVKTRWKYVWVLILALSVWDHFIWTQLAPWWWVVVGVSTAGGIASDKVFRGQTA